MCGSAELEVSVERAYKRYSPKAVILRGLSMKIPKGCIYGLLGPSGCGKTTLLSCIIGSQRLDAGSIDLRAQYKMQVGYMPQEISLNAEFTVMEALMFFGRLYGLSKDDILTRSTYLNDFLELPNLARRIGNCSGGQQRRISMAVALIHDPQLLILDEPTVGVDPLLSNRIWEHFVHMAATKKTTIIITTHYIEEARNANLVGLMRGGILLAEETPEKLMVLNNCDSLEEAFLKLSQKQHDIIENEIPEDYPAKQKTDIPLQSKSVFRSYRFRAQLIKNVYWTTRDLHVTIIATFMPAVLYSLLGIISHGEQGFHGSDLPLSIINYEPECSNLFLPRANCKLSQPFSCRFLGALPHDFRIDKGESLEQSMREIHKGKYVGVLMFPKNYSQSLIERLVRQTRTSPLALNDSLIQIWLDTSDYTKTFRLNMKLYYSMIKFVKEVCLECGYNPKLAELPIKVEGVVYGENVPSVTASCFPAFACSIAFFTSSLFAATALLTERKSGIFARSQAAGLTELEVILAHVVLQLAVMFCQTALSFAIIYLYFSFPMEGSIGLVIIVITLTQISGMVYGFLLAIIIGQEINVTYAAIGTVLTLFMLCGTLWPIEGLHWILRIPSSLIPVTSASFSFGNIALRGWGISSSGVYSGIGSLILSILLFSFICFAKLKSSFF